MAETESIKSRRAYSGPAILEQGFRPFFFLAGIWALIPLSLWIAMYLGYLSPLTAIDTQAWHSHEMIFGYAGAALAGFALTAIPNWTGRLPVRGNRLFVLIILWLSARLLMVSALFIDSLLAASIIEASFMTVFSALVFREIIVGKNWRNLPVALVFSVFGIASILSNLESLEILNSSFADRFALATLVMLISLIGGRIIPSFTQGWLKQEGVSKLPVAFNQADKAILLISAGTLITWLALPYNALAVTTATALCSIVHLWRLSRWCGLKTLKEPLVLMLHVAYLWIPTGFAMATLTSLDLMSESAVIHAWTVGAIASMTLAVMMRATLGHAGHPLKTNTATTLIFSLITLAALSRVLSAIISSHEALLASVFLWIVCFILYLISYAPIQWSLRKKKA